MEQDRGNGFGVRLGDLVFAVSAAMDFMSPALVDHHLRVARIARAIARQLNLPLPQQADLLLAAALHDAGAFSLRERLDLLRFEVAQAQRARRGRVPAAQGVSPLRAGRGDWSASTTLPWEHGRGEMSAGRPVPLGSHLLHLADRASVLPVNWSRSTGLGRGELRAVADGSGSRFVPEFVEALARRCRAPGLPARDRRPRRRRPAGGPGAGRGACSRSRTSGASRGCSGSSSTTAAGSPRRTPAAWRRWPGSSRRSRASPGPPGAGWRSPAGLHDLGKLAVASETLDKERPLSREERAALRDHPLHGWRILGRVRGLEQINTWASYHHERLDGSGYPFHVPGALIPRESRIVAVADVFTALTEERPYRRGMSVREAVGVLQGMAGGGALDAEIVERWSRQPRAGRVVRRLAQEGASERYLDFLQHAPAEQRTHSAA